LHQYSDVEFVIIDGILLRYNGENKEVVIPSTVTEIYLQAFAFTPVEKITIPDSVKKIGARAFEASKLKSITLPEGITTLENGTFSRCWDLAEIQLPQSICVIKDRVFLECHSLENIVLPENVKSIGNEAFFACKNLQEIILPAQLQEVGNGCFGVCDNLKKVVFPETIKKIGDTQMYKSVKKYIIIDDTAMCYLPASSRYAKQFDKKVNIEDYKTGYAKIEIMAKTDSEINKMTQSTANRLLKVLTLMDDSLWLDYARFADEKNNKKIIQKMEKLAKPVKNRKADKEKKILLMNMRGAFMLNSNKLALKYFEDQGLKEQYLRTQEMSQS
jgi:hypothetical protein